MGVWEASTTTVAVADDGAANDDETSFRRELERIARREGSFLLFRALNFTPDQAAARDLVQQTLLRALERPPRHLVPAKLRAWLLVVMKHLAIDGIRRDRQLPLAPFDEASTIPAEPPPDRPQHEPPSAPDVAALIDALAPGMRTVFVLWVAGQKYRDIARALNLRPRTVGTRIHRSKLLLRQRLKTPPEPPRAPGA